MTYEMVNYVPTKFYSKNQIPIGLKFYLERTVYLDLLEDSRLQIMRLGESNIRQFEDSDLQILGFRRFTMDISKG